MAKRKSTKRQTTIYKMFFFSVDVCMSRSLNV